MSVEEQVLSGVECGDLGRALARLSPEMRAVVQTTVLDGLTTREASQQLKTLDCGYQQLLGVHQGAVKTRLYRAKVQLRRELLEGSV
ncbi:MAG TPA: sigma factor-like helix-turn-helix DNA-binding protein [Nakamurella sp.]|nr:sigma factor-like helix-turn-helix DNA-binding protein [Nakamurella sp.]